MRHLLVPLAFFAMVTLITAGRPLFRAWARRIEGGAPRPALDPEAQARLERMEQAIEAMAIEVERIAEGQRFTTKLLAERAEQRAEQRAPRGQDLAAAPASHVSMERGEARHA